MFYVAVILLAAELVAVEEQLLLLQKEPGMDHEKISP